MTTGQIRKALSGFYYVYFEGETYQTRARGNFRNRKITPLVGDQVIFESQNSTDGYLLEILPRTNELVRPPVANVDQGIVVMSAIEPKFSKNLLDRFLVTLEYEQIQPIIYVSKVDKLDETAYQEIVTIKKSYEKIGYPVIVPDFQTAEQDLTEIIRYFPNRLSVFMGQSGAGKSTLLNKIAPELNLETAMISKHLGRGKHTTRHVELLPLYDGLVADTPGFSSIDFLEMTATELPKQFPEFVAAAPACKFRECSHRHEPHCEVQRQVEQGEITKSRYDNYLLFLEEIEQRKPIYRKK
ncbi:ribosome small subunit-dependent GTPase A [Vagococcus entomophilus]|uniref:Small ribosomal subunit biogenesis GTPase RsgA n=1 Tax=Vagococcus entomophilus TaxID=1160095 RepID=A0A430AFS6_9ENTE|nr:ribosome small subunit-dependent GTPase A [Vagococcus entomophilus]RSU06586.1 ribosome small subunit-dependent GTPase A [Vagococcus entomophilus]